MMSRHQGIKTSRHQGVERNTLASRRGFTLVELLVAIAVLLAVIIAMSRIFATVSDVTGIGQATATIMQEAAVIERRMREDIAALSPEGIFAIRQVAVPNNVNGDENLLDPALPPDYVFRSDQLLFFADGVHTMQTFRLGAAGNVYGQGPVARVYWGHAFQLPNAPGYDAGANQMYDPQNSLTPWYRGQVRMVRTLIDNVDDNNIGTNIYERVVDEFIDATQPPPGRWLLARQPVALVDDDTQNPNTNAKTVYLKVGPVGNVSGGNQTARSIFLDSHTGDVFHPVFGWSREIRNGRMDGAASLLSEIRRYIRTWPDTTSRTWNEQRNVISNELLYYPRAEKYAPSMHRVDQALTNHVIGTAVSDFIIEWTWDDGTGDLYDESGNRLLYHINDGSPMSGEIRSEADLGFPVLTDSEHYSLYGNDVLWWPFGFYTNWFRPTTTPPYEFQPEQPWFGINRTGEVGSFCLICPDRGVGFYSETRFNFPTNQGSYQIRSNFKPADTIFPNIMRQPFNNNVWSTVERWRNGFDAGMPFSDAPQSTEIRVYEAIFGFNRTQPMRETTQGPPTHLDDLYRDPPFDPLDPARISPLNGYTPWPSAIRVTMTLHDPQGRLESGRQVQFVIELPRRVRSRSQ